MPLSPWEAGILRPYGDAPADLEAVTDAVPRNAGEDVSLRTIAVQLGSTHSPAVESAIRFIGFSEMSGVGAKAARLRSLYLPG